MHTYQKNSVFLFSALFLLCISSQLRAQNEAPFRMPSNGNKDQVYGGLDYYHFSAAAWDSQNRPYGFNINEEFGYIRTLRNGLWKNINYLDDLREAHPGEVISTANTPLDHALSRISITTDNHLYMTLKYKAGGQVKWAILYLDNLDTESFQVIPIIGNVSLVHVEEFTGHNLKNRETPAIMIIENGETFVQRGWNPEKKYPWTVRRVYIVKVAIPFRNINGTIRLNTIELTSTGGHSTIHSGGDAILATKGSVTYATYTQFDGSRIDMKNTSGKNITSNVNYGFVAQITRPDSVSANASVVYRNMGLQFPFDAIDSHSQGSIVFDSNSRLHYIPSDHVISDKYYRSTHATTDPQFDFLSHAEWTHYGTVTPTNSEDFSYETMVIDNNNQMYTAYRQRSNRISAAPRGLYIKNTSVTTTDWGGGYGLWLITPPSPYDTNGEYIIFYHRLWMDRNSNIHASATFFEFATGSKGRYPRINGYRTGGSGTCVWKQSSRYRYLENIINPKTVQMIDFTPIPDISTSTSTFPLQATSNVNLTVSFEVLSGPATLINNNKLKLHGAKGVVTVRAFNNGNAAYYADEIIQSFKVTDRMVE